MKQRIIAVLLALCLFLSLVPAVSAAGPTLEDCVDLDQLVAHACQMFSTLEGHYDSVTPKDSNACSIGFMQWHGEGARTLLKMISAVDPVYSEEVLGTDFFNEINTGANSWKERKLNTDETAKVKTLISSEIGIQCQNTYASETILSEAKTGWKRGVRTEPALLYYCSIENQFGIGGANNCMRYLRETTGMSASDTFNTLEYFHNAWLAAAGRHQSAHLFCQSGQTHAFAPLISNAVIYSSFWKRWITFERKYVPLVSSSPPSILR